MHASTQEGRSKGYYCISTQGSSLSQSSPAMGMAASWVRELPVPGGVCMTAEEP